MANPIERLKARIDRNRDTREQERMRTASRIERNRAVRDAPAIAKMDFWCERCTEDFTGPGYKVIRTEYDVARNINRVLEPVQAHFTGLCSKGHAVVRYITDKHCDPYYTQSHIVRQQRAHHAADLIQPGDPLFAIYYPDAWRKLEQEREERDAYAKHHAR